MIPLKLELTNFLSYRQTAVLEFDGIHLACISGANGAGKSTLLDAMTWALFGQARSRSDDDLVNRLATVSDDSAEVRLTFSLENTVYRVIRRKRSRKSTLLDLQIAINADHTQWKTLSESKVRETQLAIERLLRMSYDTFSNASFLLQGKADEFTTKTPNQRKEILADLLGVSQWDLYRDKATERRKQMEAELQLLDGRLGDIETELTHEPERQAQLAAAKAELVAISERLALREQILGQIRQTAAAIEQQKQAVNNLAANVAQAQRSLVSLQESQARRQTERQEYAAIVTQADQIAADYAAYQATEGVLRGWQEKANQHNRLLQACQPHALAIAQARTRLEQQQQGLMAQLAQVMAAQQEQTTVVLALTNGRLQLTDLSVRLAALAEQEAAWQAARSDLQQLEGERQLWSRECDQLNQQARQVGTVREEQTAVGQNLIGANQRLSELSAQIAALGEQNQRYSIALAERDALQAQQSSLREAMDKMKERENKLTTETGRICPLCGQPLSEHHRQTVLAELTIEGKKLGDRFRDNKPQIKMLAGEVEQLQRALQERPRLERDWQAQQQRQAKAEARLAEIAQALAHWEAEGAQRLAELSEKLADETAVVAQKQRVMALAAVVNQKGALEKEHQTQQRQVAGSEARLAEIERIIQNWGQVGEGELAAASARLAQGAFDPAAQAALAALDGEIAALGYDASAHDGAQQDLLRQQPVVAQHQALRQAEAAVKPLEDMLADLAQRIDEQAGLVDSLTQQQATAVVQLETLMTGHGDLLGTEDEVFHLRDEQIAANRRVAVAQQQVGVLDDLRSQARQLRHGRTAISRRIQQLKLVETACGRDGVQALLIEHALPEIEERANDLLERLTGGEMRVVFDTQKQLKSRDALVETLDIRISDGAGERPYENYSGGEQFRVNFAIRLALSQVLAQRAGARLQTLVVDEGFGSQDPNGRQRLIEAINAIQDDFACILIITHIDELRDAFPTRIEVEKTAAGSRIKVF